MEEAQQEPIRVPPKDETCSGTWVKLDGMKEYLIAPLNFRSLKALRGKINDIQAVGIPNSDQIDIMLEVTHAAIKRNYPALQKDQLEDMIDMGNFQDVFMAVIIGSGLEKKVDKPGEAQAAS